jgi:hypothetical protein
LEQSLGPEIKQLVHCIVPQLQFAVQLPLGPPWLVQLPLPLPALEQLPLEQFNCAVQFPLGAPLAAQLPLLQLLAVFFW